MLYRTLLDVGLREHTGLHACDLIVQAGPTEVRPSPMASRMPPPCADPRR